MPNTSIRVRRLVYGALGVAVLGGSAAAVSAGVVESPAPRVLADCNDLVDTTDSFSMDCAPSVIPDVSDQLTESEVAQPGWNAVPGGGTGPHR